MRYKIRRGAAHEQRWGNDACNRLVLKEDLCYFFVPMEQLAEVVGIDVPAQELTLALEPTR